MYTKNFLDTLGVKIMLSKLVYEIVESQPAGMQHVEVVQEVLRRGYVHEGDKCLSRAIYDVLKSFVFCGSFRRIQDDILERRYKIANN